MKTLIDNTKYPPGYNYKPAPYNYDLKVAANIKKLRNAFGMSQAKLGRQIGLKHGMISRYEQGLNYPDIMHLIDICNTFKVGIETILFRDFDISVIPK
jgi:transcriptional regulator with XRE-family HTH domain